MILNLQEVIQWSYDEKDVDKAWEIYKLAIILDRIDRKHNPNEYYNHHLNEKDQIYGIDVSKCSKEFKDELKSEMNKTTSIY